MMITKLKTEYNRDWRLKLGNVVTDHSVIVSSMSLKIMWQFDSRSNSYNTSETRI